MSNDLMRVHNADGVSRRYFVYVAEGRNMDQWRSHADEAMLNRRWKGDCDDLASTALDVLSRQYSPGPARDSVLSGMYRLRVKSQHCPPGVPYDHMIAAVKVGGDLWIIGDTFKAAHKIEQSPHNLMIAGRIHSHSKVSEGVVWRSGFGDMLKD